MLDQAGLVVVSLLTYQIREGAVDIQAFLREHNPDVVVYDIAPPYEANWRWFCTVSIRDGVQTQPSVKLNRRV